MRCHPAVVMNDDNLKQNCMEMKKNLEIQHCENIFALERCGKVGISTKVTTETDSVNK